LSNSKTKAYKTVNYVLDYGPVIVTVVVATIVSLASARSGAATGDMLQWVLVVLALLATTQLLDRFRVMRDMDAKLDGLISRSEGFGGATSFFAERIPPLEERLSKAKTIGINGMTLSSTSDKLWGTFKQQLADGAKIRLMTIDPEHAALDVAATDFISTKIPKE